MKVTVCTRYVTCDVSRRLTESGDVVSEFLPVQPPVLVLHNRRQLRPLLLIIAVLVQDVDGDLARQHHVETGRTGRRQNVLLRKDYERTETTFR